MTSVPPARAPAKPVPIEDIWRGTVLIVGPGRKTEGGITEVITRMHGCLAEDPNVEAVWIQSHRSGGFLAKLAQAVAGIIHLLSAIPRADIVHIHSAAQVSFVRKSFYFWIARLWRKPVIWHLHSPDIDFRNFFARKGVIGRYARHILGKCERVVVLSDSWVALAKAALPGARLHVIYNPAPPTPAVTPEDAEKDPQRILYLAHLIPRKGYTFLIRAFAALAPAFPRSRLVFAGSGEVNQAIALCRELNVIDRVSFLGWIGEPDRTAELCRAGILALPSWQEGLPMGILEAMKFGLAVVATPVGGIPDVVKDGYNGVLVPPGDAEALARALSRLLEDDALRARLGAAAKESVAAYEPSVLAHEWKKLYRDVESGMKTEAEAR